MMACGTAAGRLSRVLGTQSPVERVSSYGLGRHRAGPWMNRCGLTSGKKSLVTAQNNNELKKNNQGVQQRSKLDTGARLEMFPGQAIKKKKKKSPPPRRLEVPVTDRQTCSSVSYCLFGLFSSAGFFGAPETVLFHPKLGSDCSGAPSSLRLPDRKSVV